MSDQTKKDFLIASYKDQIEELICDCEHAYRLTIDYELLDTKIIELFNSAKNDGLSETILWEIIQKRIPAYINYKNYKSASKRAA